MIVYVVCDYTIPNKAYLITNKIGRFQIYPFLDLKDNRRLKNESIKFIFLVHSDITLRNVYAKFEEKNRSLTITEILWLTVQGTQPMQSDTISLLDLWPKGLKIISQRHSH